MAIATRRLDHSAFSKAQRFLQQAGQHIADNMFFYQLKVREGTGNGLVLDTHSSRRKAWESLKNQIDISMGVKFAQRIDEDGINRKVKVVSIVSEDFVPYCLRHTYCTDLQNKSVPINIAKYLMWHSDISVTASVYTHITDRAIEDAAKLINGVDIVTNVVTQEEASWKMACLL